MRDGLAQVSNTWHNIFCSLNTIITQCRLWTTSGSFCIVLPLTLCACIGRDFILWTCLNDERDLVVAIHCKKPSYFISLQGLIVTTKVVGSLPQWRLPVTDVSWMRLWWISPSSASSTQRLPPNFPAQSSLILRKVQCTTMQTMVWTMNNIG